MPCPLRSGRDPPGLGALPASCPHPARRLPFHCSSAVCPHVIGRSAHRRTRQATGERPSLVMAYVVLAPRPWPSLAIVTYPAVSRVDICLDKSDSLISSRSRRNRKDADGAFTRIAIAASRFGTWLTRSYPGQSPPISLPHLGIPRPRPPPYPADSRGHRLGARGSGNHHLGDATVTAVRPGETPARPANATPAHWPRGLPACPWLPGPAKTRTTLAWPFGEREDGQ